MEGLCQKDVEEQIQHDGHDVKCISRETCRPYKEWHRKHLPSPGPMLPLDFDPV